jgi:hypothetical protein
MSLLCFDQAGRKTSFIQAQRAKARKVPILPHRTEYQYVRDHLDDSDGHPRFRVGVVSRKIASSPRGTDAWNGSLLGSLSGVG